MTQPRNLPACLIIMDGFGLAEAGPGNAISRAETPNLDRLTANFPHTRLRCSGEAVGLPEGQMGNSEVGHLNIGAGRVVYQELTRITAAIEDGSLFDNEVLAAALDAAISEGRAIHFMGLLSDGGVHSHQEHLYALLEMAKRRGADRVFVHAFLDGRDVSPTSGAGFVRAVTERMERIGVGAVASVTGRYWAMDRDNRWDRVGKAYSAMVLGKGESATDAAGAIEASYAAGTTDEFVAPTVIVDASGQAIGRVEDGDALVFFNFRPDRAREISRAFVDPGFDRFARPVRPLVRFVCLTQYDTTIPASVAFAKDLPECTLADVLADAGLRQFHTAETEKYAHVTFFLNGGSEEPKLAEERLLIPSPQVPTYDLQPEMSAPEVTRALVEAIGERRADVYIVNYANCDMVGHTGIIDAAVAAVEAVDAGVGAVVDAIQRAGGVVLITADHGNAEQMYAKDGSPFTAHTNSDVPLICVAPHVRGLHDGGKLADVAPTLLDLIGVQLPPGWTGSSLLVY